MFGSVGGFEIALIVVLALLLFGPRRLPQIGRQVGRALSDLRRATGDFRVNLEREVGLEEFREVKSGVETVGREVRESVAGVGKLNVDPLGEESERAKPIHQKIQEKAGGEGADADAPPADERSGGDGAGG